MNIRSLINSLDQVLTESSSQVDLPKWDEFSQSSHSRVNVIGPWPATHGGRKITTSLYVNELTAPFLRYMDFASRKGIRVTGQQVADAISSATDIDADQALRSERELEGFDSWDQVWSVFQGLYSRREPKPAPKKASLDMKDPQVAKLVSQYQNLSSQIDQLRLDSQRADSGAYGQDQRRIQQLLRQQRVLVDRIDQLRDNHEN